MITINISEQSLEYKGKSYSISTAINGTGEIDGSYCTPTGKFKIAEKIGANLELGSVLVEREPTGEIYNTDLSKKNPDRDWILTRILWLDQHYISRPLVLCQPVQNPIQDWLQFFQQF